MKSLGRLARSVAMMTHRPVIGSLRNSGNWGNPSAVNSRIEQEMIIAWRLVGQAVPPAGYRVRNASRIHSIRIGFSSTTLTMSKRTRSHSTPARRA